MMDVLLRILGLCTRNAGFHNGTDRLWLQDEIARLRSQLYVGPDGSRSGPPLGVAQDGDTAEGTGGPGASAFY